MFGKEVKTNLKAIVSILVIIIIGAILKTIGENLENQGITKDYILCTIYPDSNNYNDKFFGYSKTSTRYHK